MRPLLTLAALTLAACPGEPASLESELLKAQQRIRTEKFGLVLAEVDSSLHLAEQRNDIRSLWRFRFVKAEALLGRERYPREVLTLLTSHGDLPNSADWSEDRARWLILQARATYSLDLDKEVPGLLDRADEAATLAGLADLAAEIELRRGFLLSDAGKFEQAHLTYGHVLDTSRRLHDRYLEARTENRLGLLLQSELKHEEAIPHLERSRSLAREIGATDTAARAEGNLAYSYFRLGDYDNALSGYTAAESEFSSSGNLREVQIWTGNSGDVYYSTRDFQKALDCYRRALEIARHEGAPQWIGFWLNNLASVAIEQRDWDAAKKYNDEALKVKRENHDTAHEISSLINAAQISAGQGDLDGARVIFESALHKDSDDPTTALEVHAGLADIHARSNRPRQAEMEFRNTIAHIDDRQSKLFKEEYRLMWLDSLIRFYQSYVDFLMDRKQADRALEAAESSRGKVLTGQSPRQLTAPEYKRLARETNSVLLEYWLGPDHSYLWVVTPEKVTSHELPPKSEILPLVRSYRAVVTGGRNPLDVASDTGLRLYNALLAPAMRDAGSATQFIIVPDDELYSLNFETLPDGINSNRYWIDRATVRISPALNYLAANMRQPHEKTKPKLLLIGDAVSSLAQYPHLENAGKEISSIADAMPLAQPLIIRGRAATPDSYRNAQPGDFGFIHFAAHAAAAAKRESALDSAVILSGPPDRYRLAARDVLSIPLSAELVTVSACRSAGGKTYGGEGLVGFAWAFMKAGAGNVIAGLWDVNDQSTVQLMTGLYSQIGKGVPVAEALRSSKLALIHGGGSYARPFYWAPFQLYTGRP